MKKLLGFTIIVIVIVVGIYLITKPSSPKINKDEIKYGMVIPDKLYVYSEANEKSVKKGYLNKGDNVEVLQEKKGWLYIRRGGVIGYSLLNGIKIMPPPTPQPEKPVDEVDDMTEKPTEIIATQPPVPLKIIGRVVANSLNLRSEPNQNSSVITGLTNNTEVEIFKQESGWYQIKVGDKSGWASARYIRIENPINPEWWKTPKEILASMSLEEKVNAVFFIGLNENISNDRIITLVQNDKPGGIILFNENYDDFRQLYGLTQVLHSLNMVNKAPLFIGIDQEGGTVTRLPSGYDIMPDAYKVGKKDDLNLTEMTGRITGIQLSSLGINVNFAPVSDIVFSKNNSLLYKRSYGDTPEEVSDHTMAFLRGLESENVFGSVKHFPGHGDTATDSHTSLPIINISTEQWNNREAIPFKSAISGDVSFIMVGHIAYPAMDPSRKPATRSKIIMTDILRNEMGFKNIIITDALEMGGFAGEDDLGDAAVESFAAGADMLLIGHGTSIYISTRDKLLSVIKSGEISQNRLDESVLRILKVKEKLQLFDYASWETAKDARTTQAYKDTINSILN